MVVITSSKTEATSPNSVSVLATPTTAWDANSGLYTYSYSFTNHSSSALPVNTIMIVLNGASVLDVTTPTGWSSAIWRDGRVLDFAATELAVPNGWVDNGQVPPSPYQIGPGQTLGGFSFKSPDPPGTVDFHVQGFTDMPNLGVYGEDAIAEPGVKPPSAISASESFKSVTTGPQYSSQLFAGGGHPDVSGFLVIDSPLNGASPSAPVQVDVTFSASASVDQSTFRATLNNHNVTSMFQSVTATTRRATFPATHPALRVGLPNTLLTIVTGLAPGGSLSYANDIDRIQVNVK